MNSGIADSADFSSLVSATGLNSLVQIGGEANFSSLTETKNLADLVQINGAVNLSSLSDISDRSNFQTILPTHSN